MNTLAELKSGRLNGVTRLQLVEGLTQFPLEILTLADTLEVLDLSNNNLTTLPD
ncbi:MAG: protein kinase, partial [Pseudomonadota bacterium]|nr:protein kinase [Pseudomonadota bacterium]